MLRHRPQVAQQSSTSSAIHDAWATPPMTPPSPTARSLASSVPSTVLQELHATYTAVKVHFESQYRRVGREDAALHDFGAFCAQMRSLFHHDLVGLETRGPHRLQYVDDEGDTVTVASTPELAEALVSQRPARSALRFDITLQFCNPEMFRFSFEPYAAAPIEQIENRGGDDEFEIHPRIRDTEFENRGLGFGREHDGRPFGHHHGPPHGHHSRFGGRGHGGHHRGLGHHTHPHPHFGHHGRHHHGFHHRGPHAHHHPFGHPAHRMWGPRHPPAHHGHHHGSVANSAEPLMRDHRAWEEKWENQLNPRWGREEMEELPNDAPPRWADLIARERDGMDYGTLRVGDEDAPFETRTVPAAGGAWATVPVVAAAFDGLSDVSTIKLEPYQAPWPRPATASRSMQSRSVQLSEGDEAFFDAQSIASVPTVVTNTDQLSSRFPTMLETFMQLRDRVMEGLDRVQDMTSEEVEESADYTKVACKIALNDVRADFRAAKSIAELSSRLGYPDAAAMETVQGAMASRLHLARVAMKQKKRELKSDDEKRKREMKKEKQQQRNAARLAQQAEKQREKEAKKEQSKEKELAKDKKKADKKGKQKVQKDKGEKKEKKQAVKEGKFAKKMAKKAAKVGAQEKATENDAPVARGAESSSSSAQYTILEVPPTPATPEVPPAPLSPATPNVGGYGYTDDFDSEDFDVESNDNDNDACKYEIQHISPSQFEDMEDEEEDVPKCEEAPAEEEVAVPVVVPEAVPTVAEVDPFEENVARFMELGVGNETLARRLLAKHSGSLEAAAHDWLFSEEQ